jgi:hypothetical protein
LIRTPLQHDIGPVAPRRSRGARRLLYATVRAVILPIVLLVTAYTGGVSVLHAQSDDGGVINREYAIKAAYLYQFGHYIQWPANSYVDKQSTFEIGVLGADPFGGALDEIARDKKIDGRRIVIRRFTTMDDYKPCHILFITSSAPLKEELEAIQKTRDVPVLLVGESPGFAQRGGTINLFIEQNKVRFEVNMEVAKQEQLKISSKLLSLAKIVGTP